MENLIAASAFLMLVIRLIVTILILYLAYRVVVDPSVIGWFVGEIARGFREAFP